MVYKLNGMIKLQWAMGKFKIWFGSFFGVTLGSEFQTVTIPNHHHIIITMVARKPSHSLQYLSIY